MNKVELNEVSSIESAQQAEYAAPRLVRIDIAKDTENGKSIGVPDASSFS